MSWTGLPPVSCTNCIPLAFYTKFAAPGSQRLFFSRLLVNSSLRSRSTRQDADLSLPRVRTEADRRRLLFGTVQQYNGLPPEVRSMSLGRFKRSVSDLLLG